MGNYPRPSFVGSKVEFQGLGFWSNFSASGFRDFWVIWCCSELHLSHPETGNYGFRGILHSKRTTRGYHFQFFRPL